MSVTLINPFLSPPGGGGPVVTLTDFNVNWSRASFCYAGVRVNADGTVDRHGSIGTAYGQMNAETDWIIPNEDASGLYEVRCTLNSGTLEGSSDATGSWLALSSDRLWRVFDNSYPPATAETAELFIEIRYDGGSVLDSCTVNLSANRTS